MCHTLWHMWHIPTYVLENLRANLGAIQVMRARKLMYLKIYVLENFRTRKLTY